MSCKFFFVLLPKSLAFIYVFCTIIYVYCFKFLKNKVYFSKVPIHFLGETEVG